MKPNLDWWHGLRIAAVLGLLGLAAFPLYWMLVTSLTPSPALFAAHPQMTPSLAEAGVYAAAFSNTAVPKATIALFLIQTVTSVALKAAA